MISTTNAIAVGQIQTCLVIGTCKTTQQHCHSTKENDKQCIKKTKFQRKVELAFWAWLR